MRESIYYCKRRLCATSHLFFNLLLLFASHTVTITITYLSLCFISCLVSSRRTAYSSINLYSTFKHFSILACVYAHISSCAFETSRLLIAYSQQDSSLLCYLHDQVYSSCTFETLRLLMLETSRLLIAYIARVFYS